MIAIPPTLAREVEARSQEFESLSAEEIVAWAIRLFSPRLTLACSFQDCVLVDMVVSEEPTTEVLFIDTGFHFPETLQYVDVVARRYELNLRIVRAGLEADASKCGTPRCCELRKVKPLNRALRGQSAWMSGLKRCDAPTRACAPTVSLDEARQLVKVNPLARWSDEDVERYIVEHQLPVHPLRAHGYLSIGCAPTTTPVALGDDRRSGRWKGTRKVECGLHT